MYKKIPVLIVVVGLVATGIVASSTETTVTEDYQQSDRHSIEVDRSGPYTNITELDSFIVQTMDGHHFPGVAASIVKEGEIIWAGTYGWANIEDSIEVADTTVFFLASVSKAVTAVALMQLWERGLFGLDDDINDYLPFEVVHSWYPDSVMTIRMLLTHTSGITDNWNVLVPLYTRGGDCLIPLDTFLVDYLIPGGAYYSVNNFMGMPGVEYDYCSVDVSLAAYLIEVITGVPFDQWCNDSIFTALEMHETSWFLMGLDTSNIAIPYDWSQGSYHSYLHCGFPFWPGNQLRSSTAQLARFLIAFMQKGQIDGVRILDSTTVELITTVQHWISPTEGIGLLWRTPYVAERWLWGHGGSGWGCKTLLAYCPEESSGVVFLANGGSEDGAWSIITELFEFAAGYPYDCGDYNCDGTITAADAIYVVSYIYRGGRGPIGQRDVNSDGRVTIADATYLVGYIYRGGPPPCEPPVSTAPAMRRKKRMER